MFADFHSHILPEMDDGSRSVKESLALIRDSAEQGITVMAATPHFYAWENDPAHFLRRRDVSVHKLLAQLTLPAPHIVCGAEVHYFEGIARSEEILRLRLEGTDLLLVEMPFGTWSSHTLDEVMQLSHRADVRVVLAHIERYLARQKHGVVQRLADEGCLMQSNASFFLEGSGRRRALRMLRDGQIHVLGSDCHNTDIRPQRLGQAQAVIERRLGSDYTDRLAQTGQRLLAGAEFINTGDAQKKPVDLQTAISRQTGAYTAGTDRDLRTSDERRAGA